MLNREITQKLFDITIPRPGARELQGAFFYFAVRFL